MTRYRISYFRDLHTNSRVIQVERKETSERGERDREAETRLVTWHSNLDESFRLNLSLLSLLSCHLCRIVIRIMCVPRCSPRQVRLMLLSLSVREVGTFVGVNCKTESTFETSQVVAKDVRVLHESVSPRVVRVEVQEGRAYFGEVDRLQGEFA